MLQITDNSKISPHVSRNNLDNNTIGGANSPSDIGGSIENLSTIAKFAKSKKRDFANSTKDFAKRNFETDFFTPQAKKTFIYL